MIIDPIAAIRQLCLQTDITAQLVGSRVFVYDLPQGEVNKMPRKALVLRGAGGGMNQGYMQVASPRVDFWSYGETEFECGKLDLALLELLHNLTRVAVNGMIINNAFLSGGSYLAKEAETGWPIIIRSAIINVSIQTI